MDRDRFNILVDERIQQCINVLVAKDKEYSRNNDRFHNFKKTARIDGETPERALWGIWKKQLVSIIDMVDDLDDPSASLPSLALLDEKFNDNHNYLYLLEGLLRERIEDAKDEKAIKLSFL